MSGLKRGAHEAHLTPRSSPKELASENAYPPSGSGGESKCSASAEMPPSTFKKALPLHVNLTHTPPKLPDDDEVVVPDDPGHIGTLALIPCVLPSGSYGWRGERVVQVELLDVERGEERKQVEVVLSVEAAVVDNQIARRVHPNEPVSEADGGTEGYESDNEAAANGSSL